MWCVLACRLIGLEVRVAGQPSPGGPTLYVSNHVSYIDIAVLSQLIGAAYVAKSEVAGWPLFGAIAKLTGTIFVDRTVGKVRDHSDDVQRHLGNGRDLILFPEGTTTDGFGVAPFKSALMAFAGAGSRASNGDDRAQVIVQPVSLAYTRLADGTPLSGTLAPLYAWYDDTTLIDHMWRVLGLRGAVVEVRFHPPVRAGDFAHRKDLARHCHTVVDAGVRVMRAPAEPRPVEVAAAAP